MLGSDGQSFVKLPHERILYTSPPRTCLQITASNIEPDAPSFSAKSDGGVVYITNQRLVYLPTSPTQKLKSFSSPILNLQDTYVRTPLFGANFWIAQCKTVPGGGIPTSHPYVELKMTFQDGGAFDFHSIFEQIKERLSQTYSVAQETTPYGTGLTNIDLEPLPAYQPADEIGGNDEIEMSPPYQRVEAVVPGTTGHIVESRQASPDASEAPPEYEEIHSQADNLDLEPRLRRDAESSTLSV
ncbi:UPF0664 stress-induced protein C29B12.11c [Golovinomyces cichoracearum]|uniref:UPF0664 stress-induced protein C29B12.11c n=1 Tax=Golovinomyces cichoracearum TaxID=62708 RepID=A0A420JA43_9PEZI|nr:UPF0664 stress-induced protein C29B12.11c [Golovinomyces cichoracearum]